MKWLKKYVKEITASAALATMLVSMTVFIIGSIHGVENRMITRMDEKFAQQDIRFAQLEKDITIIKTVLIMKNMLPQELAANEEIK